MAVQHRSREASTRVTAYLPLHDRWRFRFVAGGRCLDVACLWTTAARWERRPESRSPTWAARRIGPFVLALRLHLGG